MQYDYDPRYYSAEPRYYTAVGIPRRACACGETKSVIQVIPGMLGDHDWFVKCLNPMCKRKTDILFKDPIEAVNYWNAVGYKYDMEEDE